MVSSYFPAVSDVGLKRTTMLMTRSSMLGVEQTLSASGQAKQSRRQRHFPRPTEGWREPRERLGHVRHKELRSGLEVSPQAHDTFGRRQETFLHARPSQNRLAR